MLDPKFREDFPILKKEVNGKNLVYLDNACMSLRPQKVIDAINEYYTDFSSCAGRSNHALSAALEQRVHEAREAVAHFIGAKRAEEIVFTRNTSEGLNLVARSLSWQEGDVVVTTDKEHNSNLVPWLKLVEEKRIVHRVLPSSQDNRFDMEALEQALAEGVKLVSVVHAANLDGVSVPLREIAEAAHRAGALVMVDAAQSVPHQPIDVSLLDVDFLSFSVHKLCGPSGMGVLYGKHELLEELSGFLVGGDTVEWTTYEDYKLLAPPEKFEAGLQNYAGILGTGAAVEYLERVGVEKIHEHEVELNRIMTEGVKGIEDLHLIGPQEPELRGGILSFYIRNVNSHELALMLSEQGIMVRSGRHCVHSWFESQDIHSSLRASAYLYNTAEEAKQFVNTLTEIVSILR